MLNIQNKILLTKALIYRVFMIFLFGLSFLVVFGHNESKTYKLKNIAVVGATNIAPFQINYMAQEKYPILQKHSHENETVEVEFALPIAAFHHPDANILSDFSKTLLAEQFPNIYIRIDEDFCEKAKVDASQQVVEIWLNIAGVERKASAICTMQQTSGSQQICQGEVHINLADFSLHAPQHLFGLIKVKEIIIITFEVIVDTT